MWTDAGRDGDADGDLVLNAVQGFIIVYMVFQKGM